MIDLRSDTVTRPTPSMRRAMAEAEVGDDVLREDPTIRELEETAAALLGKEAALFVPSGTFGNQLALFTHCRRGGEVYLSETAHIVQHEAGASAYIGSAFLRTITPEGPWLTWEEIAPRIRAVRDVHFPRPSLICLENALSEGRVQPLESMGEIRRGADTAGLPIHLDGARIFNAAAALGVGANEIASRADSVMFCLSKGLGAPVGSLLCGDSDFIEEALFKRKIMGGGMRQAGILAAAGLIALREERPRLPEDHDNARRIAAAFADSAVFDVLTPKPEINMVFLRLQNGGTKREKRFLSLLEKEGILTYPSEGGVFRFVTHRDIPENDVDLIVRGIEKVGAALE